MSKKFKLNIKPTDLFFFGQENRYRPRKDNGIKYEADYYQVSARFPQQTTILGALRYLILDINGEIPIPRKKDQWERLIGPASFSMENLRTKANYGQIEELSPVYLEVDGEIYMPAPMDIPEGANSEKYYRIKAQKNEDVKSNVSTPFVEILGYKEKEGIPDVLKRISNNKSTSKNDILEYDVKNGGIYIAVEKIGINKHQPEDSFYKQVFYKFCKDKDVSFTLTVTLKDECRIEDDMTLYAPLGAEKALFAFSFKKTDKEIVPESLNNEENLPALLLVSDAFIDDVKATDFLFSISRVKPFRFLYRQVNDHNFGKFSHPANRYNLYQRGSIFYFATPQDREQFMEKIHRCERFKQIGYNRTLKIN